MEIGHLVDFITEYNRMHSEESDDKPKKKDTKRAATQADWDAFWG